MRKKAESSKAKKQRRGFETLYSGAAISLGRRWRWLSTSPEPGAKGFFVWAAQCKAQKGQGALLPTRIEAEQTSADLVQLAQASKVAQVVPHFGITREGELIQYLSPYDVISMGAKKDRATTILVWYEKGAEKAMVDDWMKTLELVLSYRPSLNIRSRGSYFRNWDPRRPRVGRL